MFYNARYNADLCKIYTIAALTKTTWNLSVWWLHISVALKLTTSNHDNTRNTNNTQSVTTFESNSNEEDATSLVTLLQKNMVIELLLVSDISDSTDLSLLLLPTAVTMKAKREYTYVLGHRCLFSIQCRHHRVASSDPHWTSWTP